MSKILYIEDDPINRYLVKKLLTANGFDVFEAVDGLDGLKKAADIVPDLILMDLQMPGLDGYDATRQLKDNDALSHIPVVALTAHALNQEREKCLAIGCVDFITKPIDTASFSGKIGDLLEKYA